MHLRFTLLLLFLHPFLFAQTSPLAYQDSLIQYAQNGARIDSIKKVFTSWQDDGAGNSYLEYRKKGGKWQNFSRNTINRSGAEIVFQLSERWDSTLQAWVAYTKHFDVKDSALFYAFDQTNQTWVLQSRIDRSYSKDSTEEMTIVRAKDPNKDTLLPSAKYINRFDSLGNPLWNMQFNWDTTSKKWQGSLAWFYEFLGSRQTAWGYYEKFDSLNGELIGANKLENRSDTAGRYSFQATYAWDSTSLSWDGVTKTESVDSTFTDRRFGFTASYKWNQVANAWMGVEKSVSLETFLPKSNIISNFGWDSLGGKWKETSRTETYYDAGGKNKTREKVYVTNTQTGNFQLKEDISHNLTYDSRGYVILDSLTNTLTGTSRRNKTTYTYSATGKLLTENNHTQMQDDSWFSFKKKEYVYDGKDSLIEQGEYTSNSVVWIGTTRILMWYDELGNRVKTEWYLGAYTYPNSTWKKSQKNEMQFKNGMLVYEATYRGSQDDKWIPITQNNYEYDEKKRTRHVIERYWKEYLNLFAINTDYSIVFNEYDKVSHYEKWNWNDATNKQMLNESIDVYYSTHGVVASFEAEEKKGEDAISLYPNPTTDFLHIAYPSTNSYQLLDIAGKEVQHGLFDSEEKTVDLRHLTPGMYVLKLNAENRSIARTIVKK